MGFNQELLRQEFIFLSHVFLLPRKLKYRIISPKKKTLDIELFCEKLV
jgi:hypothetical protein